MSNRSQTILFRGSICYDKRPINYMPMIVPSIREWFDGEIVVATWEGQERHLNGIGGIDKVVLMRDPILDVEPHRRKYPSSSMVRQFESFRVGIEACSGDVVCVTRADMHLKSNPFVHFNHEEKALGKYRVFESKVVVGNMMTIHPQKSNPCESYFRVGDWFHMGLKGDLSKFGYAIWYEPNNHRDGLTLTDCTERVWVLSLLHGFSRHPIALDSYQHCDEWDAFEVLLGNFSVMNSRSTLKAHNMNWQMQDEFYPMYMTEDEYKQELLRHTFSQTGQ